MNALMPSTRSSVAIASSYSRRSCSRPALSAGLEYERRLYELAMATDDRVEGMTAFIEKRRPEFKGR